MSESAPTDNDRVVAESLNRECNGLRRSRNTPVRLIDGKDYQREIAVEREGQVQKSNSSLSPSTISSLYIVESYIAFDPVSHHVLVSFEGKFKSHREKYDWQPIIILILDYYSAGRVDLVQGLITEAKEHKARFIENPEGYQATKSHLWKMERHPVIDFGICYDSANPFVAFIPREYNASGSLYEGNDMVVYAIKKSDGRRIYGLTEYHLLKKALEKRRQSQLLEKLRRLVETTHAELHSLTMEISLGEKTAFQNLEPVLRVLGKDFRLSEADEIYFIQEQFVLVLLGSKVPIEAMDGPIQKKEEAEDGAILKTESGEECNHGLKRGGNTIIISEEEYKRKGPKKARFFSMDAE